MISWEKALQLIFLNIKPLPAVKVDITRAVGMILAEDVYSKIQMPPFNKSAMDGYAVKFTDLVKTPVKLKCAGIIQAGCSFEKKIKPGQCVKIMTGAPVPSDVDCVVMIEDTRQLKSGYVEILKGGKQGENICVRGEDIRAGQKVLSRGTLLFASHVSLLASVGRCFVKVIRKPRVAVLNTGSEIIPAGGKLGKNKLYNSNGPQLQALLNIDNIESCFLGIAKDEPKAMKAAVKKGIRYDMLLISGGVSMGDYDLVPEILEKSGVKKIFHKVKIKPGKPVFFGTKNNTAVFGVPGNPVSNFTAYHLLIRPAIHKMLGYTDCNPKLYEGIVTRQINKKTGRKHFIPITISSKAGRYYMTPLSGHGSADIFTLSKSDGFMIVEEDVKNVATNSIKSFITWKKI
ncbi:MAG: molybdopterin molybdotransferase MoeA [Candidatus Omnitrophica bacterium]|nr:molybdopterin molybdotransferase MoeA [Candidatus Omnitrophota bacterium]